MVWTVQFLQSFKRQVGLAPVRGTDCLEKWRRQQVWQDSEVTVSGSGVAGFRAEWSGAHGLRGRTRPAVGITQGAPGGQATGDCLGSEGQRGLTGVAEA